MEEKIREETELRQFYDSELKKYEEKKMEFIPPNKNYGLMINLNGMNNNNLNNNNNLYNLNLSNVEENSENKKEENSMISENINIKNIKENIEDKDINLKNKGKSDVNNSNNKYNNKE